MKRTLFSGILAAAIFAAAADARAQTNVYSVNVVSHLNLNLSIHEFFVGPASDRFGLREYKNEFGSTLNFVHESTTLTGMESREMMLARLRTHPFSLWVSPWLLTLIGVPLVVIAMVAARRFRRRREPVPEPQPAE